LHVRTTWFLVLIRWPINRSNRFSDFFAIRSIIIIFSPFWWLSYNKLFYLSIDLIDLLKLSNRFFRNSENENFRFLQILQFSEFFSHELQFFLDFQKFFGFPKFREKYTFLSINTKNFFDIQESL